MPPKACIEGGCDQRIADLEEFREHMVNPESGAIGQMHEKINRRVSWKAMGTVLTVFFFIVGGSFAYTAISNANVRVDMKDANALQDKRIDDAMKEMKDMNVNVLAALNAINEHRAYTEGVMTGKKKREDRER